MLVLIHTELLSSREENVHKNVLVAYKPSFYCRYCYMFTFFVWKKYLILV